MEAQMIVYNRGYYQIYNNKNGTKKHVQSSIKEDIIKYECQTI